ncbi:hypothetical protein PsorP6_001854 [Peronosclerospora sorghi]|uniref:Uncharacterized protein n=1 Tax=Peronosclerospora sorghi TaxID=230839 RepID=A0ACC0WX31_9STRA|nr:hypothetical protein PsorP6_001854 [Peronosclerospora sorghi]
MNDHEFDLICSLDAFPADDTAQKLSVSEETFLVIKQQLQCRQYRKALRLHRQDKSLKRYVARLDGGESMSEIARSVNFSPCMMARLLLDAKYGWSKSTISSFFKELMQDEVTDANPPSDRRGLSEEEYARVVHEVQICIDEDVHCSPFADRIRHNMGVEYEYLLLETLRNRHLAFENEEMLREKGLSKTPDVRLLLPIGVTNPTSGQLHVVNWIDSKAMFGDRETHETENMSQLQGYVNRYGPGMVIYWFGHIAQLNSDGVILVTDSFPQKISLPGGFNPLATISKVEEGTEIKLQPAQAQVEFDSDWSPITTFELYEPDIK